jgi:anti-sigma regulatory factor (Ser/Thr protein kinase)
MASATCPNCGASIATDFAFEPPTTCPACCARLRVYGGLSSAGATPRRTIDLDLTIRPDGTAPTYARRRFTSFAENLDKHASSTAALLISELVTNAVIHGPETAQAAIALHCSLVSTTLQVEVTGGGNELVRQPSLHSPNRNSGWGLLLVDELADSWGVEPGRPVCVWFELAV